LKTLIINGSPRLNGDTAALLRELKSHLTGEITELSAYRDDISPCVDCRYCYEHAECAIHDDMQTVYDDDFEVVVLASPVYYGTLTGPMLSLISRLQIHHTAKHMRGVPIPVRPKVGAVILTGGGKGNPDGAVRMARITLRILGATLDDSDIATSFNTDTLPARDDEAAKAAVRGIAERLNGGAG
jgi:multimeric flavodoxin WrbA